LTGAELDNPDLREAVRDERILRGDGFDPITAVADGDDDSTARGIFRPDTTNVPAA
jgi:hypothetical protein